MNEKTIYVFALQIKQSFEITEIQYLSFFFKKVKVVVFSEIPEGIVFKENVEFVKIDPGTQKLRKMIFSKSIGLLMHVFLKDFFTDIFNVSYILQSKKRFALFAAALSKSKQIASYFRDTPADNNSIYLSLWFSDIALVLSILKNKNLIPNYFTRAHGRDLFEYREPKTGKLPFRRFLLGQANGIFSVSEAGKIYLQQKYPKYVKKIHTQYLGTANICTNSALSRGIFTITSCAKVRNIKRIHLIAEAILKLNFAIKWIHIGDENIGSVNDYSVKSYQKLIEEIEINENIDHIRKGQISQYEIFEIYKKEHINLFINVSETEGLPVSIMEAISFGIPVIATNVGGTSEIVNEHTGILLSKDFEINELIEKIESFRNSKYTTPEFRHGVRKFWEQNFSAEKNYNDFAKNLLND